MKKDLISQSPDTSTEHLAGEAFAEEQLRYLGTDVQESAIDADTPVEPDGELSSFSALILQGEGESQDQAMPLEAETNNADPIRVLDNSVVNLQEE